MSSAGPHLSCCGGDQKLLKNLGQQRILRKTNVKIMITSKCIIHETLPQDMRQRMWMGARHWTGETDHKTRSELDDDTETESGNDNLAVVS